MLKKLLIGILVLAAILVAVGFLLPSDWEASTKVTIHAAPAKIYPDVATLENWPEWSVWNLERDPSCKHEFTGPKTGTGAKWSWQGAEPPDGLGTGNMTITQASETEGMEYELEFVGFPPMKGAIRFTPQDGATEVTWESSGSVGSNLLFKYMNALGIMKSAMIDEYDKSLAKLKSRAEGAGNAGQPIEAAGKKK